MFAATPPQPRPRGLRRRCAATEPCAIGSVLLKYSILLDGMRPPVRDKPVRWRHVLYLACVGHATPLPPLTNDRSMSILKIHRLDIRQPHPGKTIFGPVSGSKAR